MGKRKQVWIVAAIFVLMLCRSTTAHQNHIFKTEEFQRAIKGAISASSLPTDPVRTLKIAYITKGGYIAATKESLLNRAILLALSKDRVAFARFLKANPNVFPLKKGIEVFLEKTVWPGKIIIRPKNVDITIWTVQEAIK